MKDNEEKANKKKVSFAGFKGLIAPVFTCFKNDETLSLELDYIDQYAHWLKSENISGVLVNGLTGEGPALGLQERKLQAEVWWSAAEKYDLMLILHIGGAPLPDVLELAEHAENLGVHAVLCLPELFYRPRNIEQLVGYCKIIARNCPTRPFFYYHVPIVTQVTYDMADFCDLAEELIPNFYGIQFASSELDVGARCFGDRRVIMMGFGSLLASGMILGFESAMMPVLTNRPDLGWEIYNAMIKMDYETAKMKQDELNKLIWKHNMLNMTESYIPAMKRWFNREKRAGFSAGPPRKFF